MSEKKIEVQMMRRSSKNYFRNLACFFVFISAISPFLALFWGFAVKSFLWAMK